MRRDYRPVLQSILCCALALPGLRALPLTDMSSGEHARGLKLFTGELPLRGRIATHATAMPPEVIRCANCHAYGNSPDLTRSTAPRLTRVFLVLPIARHGGPSSSYGRESFCVLLRRGVDPANMVITNEMPRYSISDPDCDALWSFLTMDQ